MKDNAGFILALDVDKTFLDGGVAFAYASYLAKSYFIHNLLRSVTFGVISTAEWLHSKPQTTGGEKDFMESLVKPRLGAWAYLPV